MVIAYWFCIMSFIYSFSVPIATKKHNTTAAIMPTTAMRSVSVQTGKTTPATAHRTSTSTSKHRPNLPRPYLPRPWLDHRSLLALPPFHNREVVRNLHKHPHCWIGLGNCQMALGTGKMATSEQVAAEVQ